MNYRLYLILVGFLMWFFLDMVELSFDLIYIGKLGVDIK